MVELITLFGTYIAVFVTLGIFTILYKENPWYRISESLFLGLAVGYGVAQQMLFVRDQWAGQWSKSSIMMIGYFLALLVGIMWYFRFSKKYFYIYRWPLAIIVGTGIGASLRTVMIAQFLDQIRAQALLNLWVPNNIWPTTINNICMFVMTPAVLLYFWFTGADSRPGFMKYVDKLARYTMMAGFGSAFGYTVLTRYSLFIGRAQFLLGIPPNLAEGYPAFIVMALIMLATMIGYDLMQKKKTTAV
jgi:hypothetical protein